MGSSTPKILNAPSRASGASKSRTEVFRRGSPQSLTEDENVALTVRPKKWTGPCPQLHVITQKPLQFPLHFHYRGTHHLPVGSPPPNGARQEAGDPG